MAFDAKEYHPKWTLIVRLIRIRSGNACEGSPAYPGCRAKNYEPHPITGSRVVLTTAHLDHDKSNNRFYNLRHLCQRCHLRHDLGHHIENRKFGRHHRKNQLKLF